MYVCVCVSGALLCSPTQSTSQRKYTQTHPETLPAHISDTHTHTHSFLPLDKLNYISSLIKDAIGSQMAAIDK